MTTPVTTPAFVLDPTLPWLRTDPAMQQPGAFHDTHLIRISDKYPLMAPHLPAGAEVLLTRVHGPANLVLDEVYYLQEHGYPTGWGTPPGDCLARLVATDRVREGRYPFAELRLRYDNEEEGRRSSTDAHGIFYRMMHFNGLGTGITRHMQGQHLEECLNYRLTLWRVTHYVSLPDEALAILSPQDKAAAYPTPTQRQWMNDEKALRTVEGCSEYSARILGGFPEDDYRAVLCGQQGQDFRRVLHSLPTIAPSQAAKRKSRAVAITWRSYDHQGKAIGHTKHYKREEADLLLGLLQSQTDLRRAEARVTAHDSALAFAANAARDIAEAAVFAQEAVAEPHRELAYAA